MTEWSRIVLYARFSSLGQRNGTSLERQLGDGRAYCQRKGWRIDEEVTDEGRSAFHGHHRSKGNLGDFERAALAGEEAGTLVIVERLDRLSREEAEDGYDFIRGLTKAGVSILTLDDEFIYRAGQPLDMLKIITLLIKFATAREEAVKRSDRSKSNWQIKHRLAAEEGRALSKRCPSWLRVVNDRYEVQEDKAATLLRMFVMADAGQGSSAICKTFNAASVPCVGSAATWQRERIVEFLSDRRLVGEHVIDGEVIRLYPAVIPADLFERVCGNAEARKAASAGNAKGKQSNLFAGLCHCQVCNSRMQYCGTGYLRCAKSLAGACTNRVNTPYQPFETAVLDSCLHLALDDNAFTNKAEVARLNVTIAERARELDQLTEQARKLWVASVGENASPMAGTLARETEAKATAVQANLTALKAQREKAKGRASNLEHMARITDMRQHLGTDPILRKRVAQAMQTLITRIWFDEERTATAMMAGGLAAMRLAGGKVIEAEHAANLFEDGQVHRLTFDGTRDRKGAGDVLKRLRKSAYLSQRF